MEPKRKIVISLGGASEEAAPARDYDGGATVRAPLFDEEATMGARPVVPLTEASTATSARHFPLLALVIILAIGAGVAGGFVIGVYKSRQNATTATSSSTTATATTASTDATAQKPAEPLTTIASGKSSEPQSARTTTEADNAPTERTVRDSKPPKDDDDQLILPVEIRERVRERREAKRERDDKIRDDVDERVSRRQKREQRRRARQNDERDADLDQQIERAGRDINRIRDIFEGQRP